MWSEFTVYFRLGLEHIADLKGYDHILFIAALCGAYPLRQWKRLLWLVTAFTVGHSITLALVTLDVFRVNTDLVEWLIAFTIFLTSVLNIMDRKAQEADHNPTLKYLLALGFGLIHGMGFSNFLRSALGFEEGIAWPLFAFNVGLEIGQALILGVLLVISWAVVRLGRLPHREWVLVLSGATAGIALLLMLERL